MPNTIIEIRNLTKTYGEHEALTVALDNLNLRITKGDLVAITGPSGCGKSTLLNVIAGLIVADEGEIEYKGENILQWNNKRISTYRNQSIGYVMQNFGLINGMSVEKNVLLPVKKNRKEYKSRVYNNLKSLNVIGKEKAYPYELSGGQKQRVAIARALVNDPEVLLADEPTGALDYENSQNIMKIFKEINSQGKTVIIVTHDEKIAKQCHRIVQMKDGKIVQI